MLKINTKLFIALITAIIIAFSFTYCLAVDSDIENEEENTENSTDLLLTEEATTSESEQSANTPQPNYSNILSSDLYKIGTPDVIIETPIDGNAFIMGANVTIKSEIAGSAYILADTVTIEGGSIYNSLYVCANTIIINGIVYDLYAIADTITIGSDGYIYRDSHSISDKIEILGAIGRNATLTTSNITFTNSDESETNHGIIYGNLNYYSNNSFDIDESYVEGEVSFNKVDSSEYIKTETAFDYVSSFATYIACSLIIYLLVMWLSPKFIEKSKLLLNEKIGPVIGFGILSLLAIPFFATILLIIGITSKVAFALIALYVLLLIIASSLSIVGISGIVSDKAKLENKWQRFGIAGAVAGILWLLELVPILGGIIQFATVILGLGILTKYVLPESSVNKED